MKRPPHSRPPPQQEHETLDDPSSSSEIALPSLPPIIRRTNRALHCLYSTEINPNETVWRDRYHFLLSRGYKLRPRYHPEWTPSWLETSADPWNCEDGIEQFAPMVMDATRQGDGKVVCLKRSERKSDEVEIGRYLSSSHVSGSRRNHCVEILDFFSDPLTPNVQYIAMPVLRSFDDPEFGTIGEVVDFVTQVLEGMEFMHSQLVAHGDLTGPNIMMDARPILPHGWHFVADHCTPNGLDPLTPLSRIDRPVRYVIVDYDVSIRMRPGQPHLINDNGGRDRDPPELATRRPYDPFKLDVFTLGNVYNKEFYQKYLGLDFLADLMKEMMTPDFSKRPSAHAALQQWLMVRSSLNVSMARWRLRRQSESIGERVVLDTVAAARESLHSVKRLFHGEEKKAWATT
ncbi:hypothetical protein Hypma_012979 [Hypsizygus marmoreus]|uniref:Protein kinase domain-containing protein n=1 Tax=Hypsizygus marmoreus TaxID=39966 RepID=A0A369JIA3_HYPMA|nr:hypothetical protein Hypma_012979 [Hypsizygus marmoreus]